MSGKIELTPAAVVAAKARLEKRKTPDAHVRLGVRGGNCAGYSYVIEFDDDKPRDKDIEFNFDGIKVLVDNKSLIYLDGTILDYEETLTAQGFVWKNPNAAKSCGCGKSFSVKDKKP